MVEETDNYNAMEMCAERNQTQRANLPDKRKRQVFKPKRIKMKCKKNGKESERNLSCETVGAMCHTIHACELFGEPKEALRGKKVAEANKTLPKTKLREKELLLYHNWT